MAAAEEVQQRRAGGDALPTGMVSREEHQSVLDRLADVERALGICRRGMNRMPIAPSGNKAHPTRDVISAADYSVVMFRGERFTFRGGVQCDIIAALWPSLDDQIGLMNQEIAQRLDRYVRNFRVLNYLGKHPAMNRFIKTDGHGRYWLWAPRRKGPTGTPPTLHRPMGEYANG